MVYCVTRLREQGDLHDDASICAHHHKMWSRTLHLDIHDDTVTLTYRETGQHSPRNETCMLLFVAA